MGNPSSILGPARPDRIDPLLWPLRSVDECGPRSWVGCMWTFIVYPRCPPTDLVRSANDDTAPFDDCSLSNIEDEVRLTWLCPH